MPAEVLSQDALLEYLEEVGEQEIEEIALTTDMHPITIRRKLEGLAYQGKVHITPGKRGKGGHRARARATA